MRIERIESTSFKAIYIWFSLLYIALPEAIKQQIIFLIIEDWRDKQVKTLKVDAKVNNKSHRDNS